MLGRNQRIHGADHKATLDCMNNLAYTLQELGRSAEAEAMYLDVLGRARRSLPENNRTTLSALSNLANAQVSLDKFDEALATHGELYERARAAELPHPIAAKYMMPYGMRLAKLGRYAEAEPPLREARKRLEAANLLESPAMGDVALALAVVCENTGRPDEGARWRADANRLRQPATAPATMPAPRPATAPAPAP